MKITVVTGTEQKGCTYRIKETFLDALGPGHDITEFYLPRIFLTSAPAVKSAFLRMKRSVLMQITWLPSGIPCWIRNCSSSLPRFML